MRRIQNQNLVFISILQKMARKFGSAKLLHIRANVENLRDIMANQGSSWGPSFCFTPDRRIAGIISSFESYVCGFEKLYHKRFIFIISFSKLFIIKTWKKNVTKIVMACFPGVSSHKRESLWDSVIILFKSLFKILFNSDYNFVQKLYFSKNIIIKDSFFKFSAKVAGL